MPEGKAMVIDSYGTKNKNCTKVEHLAIYLNDFFRVMVGFPKLGHIIDNTARTWIGNTHSISIT